MTDSLLSVPEGFDFIPGITAYSGGVAARRGWRIARVQLARPVPMGAGFELIEHLLSAAGRPLSALCACELRSPAPFSQQGFVDFNRLYVGTLQRWGLFVNDFNPVARSNVCPVIDAPPQPSLHAFCYTVPADAAAPASFVVAGSAEAPEGKGPYREHTVSLGDVSAAGLRAKAQWVLGEMERRMARLGFDWSHVTATQLYTTHDIHAFLADEIVRRGAARHGLTWHFNRPPVLDLEYEMDCRGVHDERMVRA